MFAEVTVGSLVLAFVTACSSGGAGMTATEAGPDLKPPIDAGFTYSAPAGYLTCTAIDAGTAPSCLLNDGVHPSCSSAVSGATCGAERGQQCLSCLGEGDAVVCECGDFDGEAGVWKCQTRLLPHP